MPNLCRARACVFVWRVVSEIDVDIGEELAVISIGCWLAVCTVCARAEGVECRVVRELHFRKGGRRDGFFMVVLHGIAVCFATFLVVVPGISRQQCAYLSKQWEFEGGLSFAWPIGTVERGSKDLAEHECFEAARFAEVIIFCVWISMCDATHCSFFYFAK